MRTLFTRLALVLVRLASLTASECWFFGFGPLPDYDPYYDDTLRAERRAAIGVGGGERRGAQ